jgi:UDP-2,3-diacylglucosamine hydrolase
MVDEAIGIVAGGGELPRAIAIRARNEGRAVFVLALRETTGDWVRDFPHTWLSMGQIGKTLAQLRNNACREVVLAGYVSRPNFLKLHYDAKGLSWLLHVLWAMRKGDNTLLEAMVGLFEREGLIVKSVADVAPWLQIPTGPLGRVNPLPEDEADIAVAMSAARRQGARDVGQAAIVREGKLLAVEGADGTDAMLNRLLNLPLSEQGTRGRGVLAKALKPIQDRKTDLPTIGVATVEKVAAAGLAGIAVEAHTALVLDRAAVARAADAHGVFVTGTARAT